jgi:hypothetical protein
MLPRAGTGRCERARSVRPAAERTGEAATANKASTPDRTWRARPIGRQVRGARCIQTSGSHPLSAAPVPLARLQSSRLQAQGGAPKRRAGRGRANPPRRRQPWRRLHSAKRSERYQARQPLLQIKLARPNRDRSRRPACRLGRTRARTAPLKAPCAACPDRSARQAAQGHRSHRGARSSWTSTCTWSPRSFSFQPWIEPPLGDATWTVAPACPRARWGSISCDFSKPSVAGIAIFLLPRL